MTRILSAWLLLVATGLGTAQEPSAKDQSYYPLQEGAAWTYQVVSAATNTGKPELVMRVAGFEPKGQDKQAARIETLVNGNRVAEEHVVQREDGIYRLSINGKEPMSPVRILKLPFKPGASWEVDTSIQGQAIKGSFSSKEEQIKVPALADKGAVKAAVSEGEFTIAGQKTEVKYWFVQGIGMVKLQLNLGGQDAILELTKYDPAPKTDKE